MSGIKIGLNKQERASLADEFIIAANKKHNYYPHSLEFLSETLPISTALELIEKTLPSSEDLNNLNLSPYLIRQAQEICTILKEHKDNLLSLTTEKLKGLSQTGKEKLEIAISLLKQPYSNLTYNAEKLQKEALSLGLTNIYTPEAQNTIETFQTIYHTLFHHARYLHDFMNNQRANLYRDANNAIANGLNNGQIKPQLPSKRQLPLEKRSLTLTIPNAEEISKIKEKPEEMVKIHSDIEEISKIFSKDIYNHPLIKPFAETIYTLETAEESKTGQAKTYNPFMQADITVVIVGWFSKIFGIK